MVTHVGGKRKRGGAAAAARTEQDKFAHKSGVLLQREAKKVRAFQVRKVVQQLKQSRSQLETAQRELEKLASGDDAAADKKSKQVKKLSGTVSKLEKELAVFKALDLKAVVARAMETTGLAKKREQARQQQQLQQQQQQSGEFSDSDDDDDGDGRYGRQLADASGSDDEENDDGFDSEEYENARKATGAPDRDASGSESDSESESDGEDGNSSAAAKSEPMEIEANSEHHPEQPAAAAAAAAPVVAPHKPNADKQLQTMLIDRILAHKQMKPLLEAIEKVLEKDERELEKKLRRQEKKALKRDRNEVLIGGRSAAAPTSLFLGSLSGRGGAFDDDDGAIGMASGHMAGAEDDIAEFLGETKKKKNRMGQTARRQKAIRMEEAAKRKQDRENGIFRPYAPRKDESVSKYGPSERPKKKKTPEAADGKRAKSRGASSKPEAQRRGGGSGASSRERGAPAAIAPRSSTSHRAPTVEASHPSWIAKQALKEKAKASLTAFSGKKISFGDDD